MKTKITCSVLLGLCGLIKANAQPSTVGSPGKAFLEVNNIRSCIYAYGNMWHNDSTNEAACEFPRGSGKHVGYSTSFWIGAKDGTGNLRVSARGYRSLQTSEFWPGPLDANNAIDSNTSKLWNRVWRVTRLQIDSARVAYSTANWSAVPSSIRDWPARGNAEARGANNLPIPNLQQSGQNYAPFVDANGDGLYNYKNGDYPKIKGDAMLWTAFNNARWPSNESGTMSLPVEVHLAAYGYARGTVADNIQFYEYRIINKGVQTLDSTRFGIWADMDLGYYNDDYMGFDSSRRMGYLYNATPTDGGSPSMSYGTNPPAAGITLLEVPGDQLAQYVPAAAFAYASNVSGGISCSQPSSYSRQLYNMMRGKNACGQDYLNPQGNAVTTLFTGNPAITSQWSECSASTPAGERRFHISTQPFTFSGNGSDKTLAFALVVSPNAGGCPNVDISGLQATADTAWKLYRNPVFYTPTGIGSLTKQSIHLYPNPANEWIRVEGDWQFSHKANIAVYDAIGKQVSVATLNDGATLNIKLTGLPAGLYSLHIQDGSTAASHSFIKE
jgi:hypothetical protein